jgi:hypothetical protein
VVGIPDSRMTVGARYTVVGPVVDKGAEENAEEGSDSPVLEPQADIQALGSHRRTELDMEVGSDTVSSACVVVQRTAGSMVRSLSAINA